MAIFSERLVARPRDGGASSWLDARIHLPVRITGGQGDHACRLQLSGIVDWDVQIFGSSAIQASCLAFNTLQDRLAGLESRWMFLDSQESDLTFCDQPFKSD